MAIKTIETNKFVYFFQSLNEIEPFNFYKQVNFCLSFVESFDFAQFGWESQDRRDLNEKQSKR